MDIKKCDTVTKYFADVTDDICVVVNVVNNERMYIEKINIWVEFTADSFEYKTRSKYHKRIEDIHNIELEVENFVLSVLEELKVNLSKVSNKCLV